MFVLGENHFRKCFSGNVGVWLVWKIEFFGNWFPLTEKKRLWLRKSFYTFIFTSKYFRREREREREEIAQIGEREEEETSQSTDRTVDRDPRSRSREALRWSRSCETLIDASRDRDRRERCFSRSHRRSRDRAMFFWVLSVEPSRASIAISPLVELASWASIVDDFFFWVLSVFFWVCLFLLLFQTLENIFREIFWNATKHMKTFSFPKNSISGKWNIFRKCFYTNQTQPK